MGTQCRAATLFLLFFATITLAAGLPPMHRCVPAIVSQLQPLGEYPKTNRLRLAISLPLRNQAALSNLLAQIYDPTSPNFHHYLTPEQFTAQFGPTAGDYGALMAFANSNGLQVTRAYPNRVVLDLSGSVGDIERAFHTTINLYRHPTGNRTFFAPRNEPSPDLAIPVLQISGLDNYALPRPQLIAHPLVKGQNPSPANYGSGPNSKYIGTDFRNAYARDALLGGAGQSVGLVEYDGYSTNDINYYENLAGLPNVPLQNISVDGSGSGPAGPTGNDLEVALDIEMAISMATNLSEVIVYIASASDGTFMEDFLSVMVTNTATRQFSSSWIFDGMSSDWASDQLWQQMAAQGQSFFQASGDSDAYTGLISFPCDSPYITQAGGTVLFTSGIGGGGPWYDEVVWNDYGTGVGSGGGISTQYPIPNWQTNINMSTNQGSATMRNTPDVAIVAQNIYARADDADFYVEGTSCSAPLWAGFAALVNEQAAESEKPPVGFLNPALDAIGAGPDYAECFHDVFKGDNTWPGSTNRFDAVAGYDLCTGWGSPAGARLIDALADPDSLVIIPHIGITSAGGPGGPFTETSELLTLTNAGTNTLTWTLSNIPAWLTVSPTTGVLVPSGPAAAVTVNLNTTASNLAVGTYAATLWFTNANNGYGQGLANVLNVVARPTITSQPADQAVVEGQTASFQVTATGGMPLMYQWQFDGSNLVDAGTISGSRSPVLTVSNVSPAATGEYRVMVANAADVAVSSNATLSIIPSAPIIVLQPTNQMAVEGQSVSFKVGAVGTTPYFYQWYFDGILMDGATNSSLTLTDISLGQGGSYSVTVANSVGSNPSSNALLTVFHKPAVLFSDDFSGPDLDPIWQTNLPDTWNGEFPAYPALATYVGAPAYTFGMLGTNTVLSANTVLQPEQRVGWSSSTNFYGDSFRYEARFNTEVLSPTTSIDGFCEIWIMNATNNNLYDLVAAFSQGGSWDFVHFASGVEQNYFNHSAYLLSDNAWYRLALQCLPGQNIRASLCDDNDNELVGYTFGHGASAYGSGYKIVFAQTVGSDGPAPTAVALDYVHLTTGFGPVISPPVQNETAELGRNVSFTVTALGTAPFGYQWYFTGTAIDGATNSILDLTNVQWANQGAYSVLVTNSYGWAFSSNATLTIIPRLTMVPSPDLPTLSWPTNFPGFVLMMSTNLASAQWVPVTNSPVESGTNYVEAIVPSGSNAFYRLQYNGN